MLSSGSISILAMGIAPLLLVAARLGGLALFAPIFGSPVIAGRIKALLFLGLAVVLEWSWRFLYIFVRFICFRRF